MPCNFHIYGQHKTGQKRSSFRSDNDMLWFKQQPKKFFAVGILHCNTLVLHYMPVVISVQLLQYLHL